MQFAATNVPIGWRNDRRASRATRSTGIGSDGTRYRGGHPGTTK